MTLKQTLESEVKAAMRSGDDERRDTLRLLLAAIKQAEVDKRAGLARQQARGGGLSEAQLAQLGKDAALTDADVLSVIHKEVKARREAIADAERAGRPDLAAENRAALAVLETYLPRPLSREEIAARARAVIAEAGAAGPAAQGEVMKRLMLQLKGQADGKLVGEVVRELLAGS